MSQNKEYLREQDKLEEGIAELKRFLVVQADYVTPELEQAIRKVARAASAIDEQVKDN
jgi:hypothetical protein